MEFLNHFMSGYTPILIFIFLCFAALLIFFIKISRNLEELVQIARYDRSALFDQLALIQETLQELVRYQADAGKSLKNLRQGRAISPNEGPERTSASHENTYYPGEEPEYDTRDLSMGLAGVAAGLAATTPFDDAAQDPAAEDADFDAGPDFTDQEEELSFDADTEENAPDQEEWPEPSEADAYEDRAGETMEFDEQDYEQYAAALAEKQAKEEFIITPELETDSPEPVAESGDFELETVPEQDFHASEAPESRPEWEDEPDDMEGEITLDLDSFAPVPSEEEFAIPDETQDGYADDTDLVIDTAQLQEHGLEFPAEEDNAESGEEEFLIEEDQSDAADAPEGTEDALPELSFHEEPESEITFSLEEEDDAIYLLDEPLTSEEDTAPDEELQDFELAPVPEDTPLSSDEELDRDLFNDTMSEPATEAPGPISDDAFNGDIVMDFPLEEDLSASGETKEAPNLEPLNIDFHLEGEDESDLGFSGLRGVEKEEEYLLDGSEEDEDEEEFIMPEEDADDDDSDLDQLVDNLLDVPEEVALEADAEDAPDFETAIIIDEDEEDEPDASGLEPAAAAVTGEESAAGPDDTFTDADLVFDLDPAENTSAATPDNAEMNTDELLLTLDKTMELGQDDEDNDTEEFLLDGLDQEPPDISDTDSESAPFSLDDLDITVLDEPDETISLDSEEEAEEDDIVLPDISYRSPQGQDAPNSGHADDLLELETDELVADAPESQNTETPKRREAASDQTNDPKSANILDFIIDE